jgi:hypothetical protein
MFIEKFFPVFAAMPTGCRTRPANGRDVYGPKSRLATAFGFQISAAEAP